MGRAAGFEVPATALLTMPDGMPPALLVERFDVCQADEVIDEIVKRVNNAALTTLLPKLSSHGPRAEAAVAEMLALCRTRAEEFE